MSYDIPENISRLLQHATRADDWFEIAQAMAEEGLHSAVQLRVWNAAKVAIPELTFCWRPAPELVATSNVRRLADALGALDYAELHRRSVEQRDRYWEEVIRLTAIPFMRDPESTADYSRGVEFPEWLPGAVFNIAEACLAGDDGERAIIFGREGSNATTEISRGELRAAVASLANGLRALGVEHGDRIAIFMPMTAESVYCYLAILSVGAIAVAVPDSLTPPEIEKRLRISRTRLVFSGDAGIRDGKVIEYYARVAEAGASRIVVVPLGGKSSLDLRPSDIHYSDLSLMDAAFDAAPCYPSDYCNILFSSGTTGDPKAIPWTHTTPIKAIADGFAHHDIRRGDVVAWSTNLGWMMGPWLLFAGLGNGASVALYDGSPATREYGEFIARAGVTMLGVIPSLVKRWMTTDCMEGLDWSRIRCFSSTGECSNADDMVRLMALAGWKPVIEYCGGTEIGGGYITGTMVQPCAPACFTTPALGLDFVILDDGEPTESGEVWIIPPSPGLSNELLNADHHKGYYADAPRPGPGWSGAMGTPLSRQTGGGTVLRRHGDHIEHLAEGLFRAHGRTDDTMNLGGIKVSSAEIERCVVRVEGIHDAAAIAVSPIGGGPSLLVLVVVPSPGSAATKEQLAAAANAAIKKEINPLFRASDLVIAAELPRTASNKVMRRVLRKNYEESRERI